MKRRKPITVPLPKSQFAEMVLDRAFARLIEAVERTVERNMPERQPEEQKAGAA